MISKIFSVLSLVFLMFACPTTLVKATDFKPAGAPLIAAAGEIIKATGNLSFAVKRSQPYDESKDPALRRGTENWEQDQGSFFTIPALVIAIIGVLLFFTRDKR